MYRNFQFREFDEDGVVLRFIWNLTYAEALRYYEESTAAVAQVLVNRRPILGARE